MKFCVVGLLALSMNIDISSAFRPTVKWIDCPTKEPKSIDCGTIAVPLDHSQPDGDTITLALTRLRANQTAGYRNSTSAPGLYIETGGPGSPNSNVMPNVLQKMATGNHTSTAKFEPLISAFDIIGVDMRGTGASEPTFKCDGPSYATLKFPMIKDKATFDQVMAANKAWADTCVNKTGSLINHAGTDQAIEDYEMVRQALGHDKFNYLGFSYGTELGSEYADKYPDRVGRMVLDGVSNRHQNIEERMFAGSTALDSVFEDFFRWCNASTLCALHGADAAGIWNDLLDKATRGELHSNGCYDGACGDGAAVEPSAIVLGAELLMHDGSNQLTRTVTPMTQNFQKLSEDLNYAYKNNSGVPFAPPKLANNNTENFAQWAIGCSDRPNRTLTVADFRNIYTLIPAVARYSRGFGQLQQLVTVCQSWPIRTLYPPKPFDAARQKRLPPIMLVNSIFDPATISPEGLSMRSIMPTAFSIYRNGSGHTSFFEQGDTAGAETAFLVNGTIPEDATVYQS